MDGWQTGINRIRSHTPSGALSPIGGPETDLEAINCDLPEADSIPILLAQVHNITMKVGFSQVLDFCFELARKMSRRYFAL
jgi:hypothetical protein